MEVMEAGEILVRRGLLSEAQLHQVRASQVSGAGAVETAAKLGFLSEGDALRAVADELGMDFVDLAETQLDLGLLQSFPQKLIHRELLFPLRRENGSLLVATADPFDLYPLDEASAATGMSIRPVLAGRQDIGKLIKAHLGVGSETIDDLIEQTDEEPLELLHHADGDAAELSEQAQEASVVRLVNEILLEAVESRASDVHIESQPSGLVVRYRVDGMLLQQPTPPEINRFHAAIISRLKIMARLNIAEKRLPQDGRMKLKVAGREVDVRVSVIPMIHGEGVVMRILDKSAMVFELPELGMEEETYRLFQELIRLPHGILLVTGPTGSGKTTTLYSALLEIKNPETKIITSEDPVEYQLEGINQIQIHPRIGLTFGNSLRSILRHDPDIILVGEIRDLETGENAIQASLTGHLVFSTLHTNDAASAYTRLVDMGVEPFLVASTVEGIMAQRLVRRLCEHCKQAYRPGREELPDDFPFERFVAQRQPLYRKQGCRQCRYIGYTGRLGLFELLAASERIRTLAHDQASSWEIRKAGIQEGMVVLRQDGWKKVLDGRTSVDEILRVTKGDRQ